MSRRNHKLCNFIKNDRFLRLSLVLLILIASFIPFYSIILNSYHEYNIIRENSDLRASSYNGGGYIMNYNAVYSWIEISTSGTLMNISNENDSYEAISFSSEGWNFTYYEKQYNTIYVSTNGWMSFTNLGDTQSSCAPIPDLNNKNIDCVALLCDDLSPFNGGDIYYEFRGLAPFNYLIIEYHNIYSDNNNYIGSFEVIFNQTGLIKFQYQNINYLSQYDAIVGLDHGDLINYNSYSGINKNNLPYINKAIEFTFNEISEIEYSLNVEIDNEYTWIVAEIDDYIMGKVFGSNWESIYGFFPDPKKFTKFKVNVTEIVENSTHWDITYSIWNWTNKINNFNTTPDGNDLLIFRKEPLNYTSPHNLTHIFPLFIPTPIFHYLNRSNLTESDSKISSYGSDGDYVVLGDSMMSSTIIDGHNIEFGRKAHYNKYGILDWMDFYYLNQSWESTEEKSIFTIYNFYDASKPLFIGVNESNTYDYGVFYSERNAPQIPLRNYSKMPNIFSLKIDFIGGYDPYFNRSLIIVNNSQAVSAINIFSAEKHPEIYYLPQNLTRFTILNRIILPMDINWSSLDFIRSDIVSTSNGFIMSLTILDDIIEFEYKYTSIGLLNTYSEYYNGKEYFTVRFNNFTYQIDDSDPIINILYPQENQTFGRIAPSYDISIIEPNLDKIWYTLDGGLNNVTITNLSGKINQILWNALPEGAVTIRFYANDTMGYLSYEDIIIYKKYEPDNAIIIIFIFILSVASVVAVSGTSYYYYQKIYKTKTREIPPIFETDDSGYQYWLGPSAKEILNTASNKKLLINIVNKDTLAEDRSKEEKILLTTVKNEFLKKVDDLGFDENEKQEFLKEMLALSPKERDEILENIMSRRFISSEPFSKEILSNLTNRDLLLQIFDENITIKKRNYLEKIELTIVSEKFLNKVDAIGLKGDMKIKFIKEMLALTPKERDEIINNILDKLDKSEI
ncbi:MAG: hypothetical protein ACFFEY_15935 [Candidatus Thorarchaeota archaeon]